MKRGRKMEDIIIKKIKGPKFDIYQSEFEIEYNPKRKTLRLFRYIIVFHEDGTIRTKVLDSQIMLFEREIEALKEVLNVKE